MPVSDLMNDGDLVRDIQTLKRQVQELMGGRRLESASIGGGGIRVAPGGGITLDGGDIAIRDGALRLIDSADREVIRIGRNIDGSYDLTAIDPTTGDTVKLAALAFGKYHEAATESGVRESSDYGPLDPVTPGETITGLEVTGIRVGTPGRMDITVGAWMQYDPGNGGRMSVEIRPQGGSDITDIEIVDQYPELSYTTGDPGGISTQWAQGTATRTVSGFDPGIYTVRAVYAGLGSTPQCFFSHRYVQVQSYF